MCNSDLFGSFKENRVSSETKKIHFSIVDDLLIGTEKSMELDSKKTYENIKRTVLCGLRSNEICNLCFQCDFVFMLSRALKKIYL